MNKWPWIMFGCAWLAVGLAVSVGIYFTGNPHCLWALLIPLGISFKSEVKKE